MKNPCGCWVSVNGLPEVIYCPLHAAAPQLAEALRVCHKALEATNTHLLDGIRETQCDYDQPPEPADQWSYDAATHVVANRNDIALAEAALRAAGIEP